MFVFVRARTLLLFPRIFLVCPACSDRVGRTGVDARKFEKYSRRVCERLVLFGSSYRRVTNGRIDRSKWLARFVVHYILGRRFWGFRTSPSLELLRAANESRRSSSRSNEPKKKREEGVMIEMLCELMMLESQQQVLLYNKFFYYGWW